MWGGLGRLCNTGAMHLHQTDAGTWRVQVRHQGRKASGTYPTKREAQRRGAQMLVELGASPTAITATLGDIIADHCADLDRHRSATYAADMARVADRLPADVHDTPCAKVTAMTIEATYRRLERDGWTPHRVRRLHELLHGAFKRAARLGVVTGTPMASVRAPQIPESDVRPPTPEQVGRIIAAPTRTVERLALHLAAVTGARRGELVALQWADLDGSSLGVRRSLAYTPAAGVHERPTKTGRKGQRVVALDAMTLRALSAWRAEQAERALEHGIAPVWILSDDAGYSPWRPDRLSHVAGRAMTTAGVEGHRLHDLRHFCATQLLAAGIEPWIVAHRLGHANVSTTLNLYAHWIPGTDSAAADVMGQLLSGR
jgi:integrase